MVELRAAADLERTRRGADERGGQDAAPRGSPRSPTLLDELGGVGLDAPPRLDVPLVVEPGHAFSVPRDPGRDERYLPCSFYWPDALDSTLPPPTGAELQLRVAISHLNEVWAVETAGAMLNELADELGWEFLVDAARWTYDEARHMLMGQRRVASWGLDLAHVPLGRYIYDAVADGGDPIYRIGMLGFFETKNIGKKHVRARAFGAMGDQESERDMQFDWADETIHAEYGRRWLRALLERRGRAGDDYAAVLGECERLVAARVARATPAEAEAITRRDRAPRRGGAGARVHRPVIGRSARSRRTRQERRQLQPVAADPHVGVLDLAPVVEVRHLLEVEHRRAGGEPQALARPRRSRPAPRTSGVRRRCAARTRPRACRRAIRAVKSCRSMPGQMSLRTQFER